MVDSKVVRLKGKLKFAVKRWLDAVLVSDDNNKIVNDWADEIYVLSAQLQSMGVFDRALEVPNVKDHRAFKEDPQVEYTAETLLHMKNNLRN